MSDIHVLVGAYAVDALDDLERAAFERHLATCSICRGEVIELREVAATLGALVETAPPGALRDRVLADIATVRPLPPSANGSSHAARGSRRRFQPRALLAAAAAVIALGAGAAVVEQQPWDDTSSTEFSAADRIRAAEDAETFTKRIDDAEATVIRSRSLNQAVLVTSDMPEAPEGKVYELWLVQDDEMVSAGLMSGTEGEVVLQGDAATATGFGITLEPEGGSEKPSFPPVAQIAFEEA